MSEAWETAKTCADRYAAFRNAHCNQDVPCSVTDDGICAPAHHLPSRAHYSASAGRSLPKSKGKPRRKPVASIFEALFGVPA